MLIKVLGFMTPTISIVIIKSPLVIKLLQISLYFIILLQIDLEDNFVQFKAWG